MIHLEVNNSSSTHRMGWAHCLDNLSFGLSFGQLTLIWEIDYHMPFALVGHDSSVQGLTKNHKQPPMYVNVHASVVCARLTEPDHYCPSGALSSRQKWGVVARSIGPLYAPHTNNRTCSYLLVLGYYVFCAYRLDLTGLVDLTIQNVQSYVTRRFNAH